MTAADYRFATRAVHSASDPSDPHRALSAPLYRSAVYALPDAERGHRIHEGLEPGYFYGRMGNPTVSLLENALAQLEGGQAGLCTASGMAALSTLLLSVLKSGDHLVAPRNVYATTRSLLTEVLPNLGVQVSFAESPSTQAFEQALTERTRVVLLESPANPTLDILDLAAIADVARSHGALTLADNTFATPVNQRPLALGVDAVIHSGTKFLGGHSDLVAGAIIGGESLLDRARWFGMKMLGGALSPDAAWLLLRGLQTLPVRVQRHNRNAQRVAEHLAADPRVKAVYYPGLPSHPGHPLAVRQMDGFGGVVTFDVGSARAGQALVDHLSLIRLGVSLGDVTSLAQHPASMTFAAVGEAVRRSSGVTPGQVRLSVGLEDHRDILDDLQRGLDAALGPL